MPSPGAAYDLRLRSLDPEPGEARWLCTECVGNTSASWSVWLHTPEWGSSGGLTRVLCTHHALAFVTAEATGASAATMRTGGVQ